MTKDSGNDLLRRHEANLADRGLAITSPESARLTSRARWLSTTFLFLMFLFPLHSPCGRREPRHSTAYGALRTSLLDIKGRGLLNQDGDLALHGATALVELLLKEGEIP